MFIINVHKTKKWFILCENTHTYICISLSNLLDFRNLAQGENKLFSVRQTPTR